MAVNLRILFADQSVKTFRFSLDSPLGDLLLDIKERVGGDKGQRDHGLFQRATKDTPHRWLRSNRTLKYYGIQAGAEIEYRKKHKVITVRLVDDSAKSVLMDTSRAVRDCVQRVADKLFLKKPAEYALRRVGNNQADWLDSNRSLAEQDVTEDELIFAKRFFSNDFDVDKDDPVQLHLVYIQAIANLLAGAYDPLLRQEVIDLAAVQVHIVTGSHDANKHKPGFLDLSKFVPPSWLKDKKLEADILVEHKKFAGTSELDAKYRYVQLARVLKSYGITIFHVLEAQDKNARVTKVKKPFEIMLVITKENIEKWDPETREVIKTWPLLAVRRWAHTTSTLALEFGTTGNDVLFMHTTEGPIITSLLSGYIDILAELRGDFSKKDEGEDALLESNFSPRGQLSVFFTASELQGAFPRSQQLVIDGLLATINGLQTLSDELSLGLNNFSASHTMTADQWSDQLSAYIRTFHADLQKVLSAVRSDPENFDRGAVDKLSRSLHAQLLGLSITAKNLAAMTGNKSLLDGAKAIADSVADLLSLIERSGQGMNVDRFLAQLLEAEKSVACATAALEQERLSHFADKGTEVLLLECIADIDSQIEMLVSTADAGAPGIMDVNARDKVEDDAKNTTRTKGFAISSLKALAPVAVDSTIQELMSESTVTITNLSNRLVSTCRTSGLDKKHQNRMDKTLKRINISIKRFLEVRAMVEARGAEGDVDLETPASLLLAALAQIRKNIETPADIVNPTKNAVNATNLIVRDTKTLADVSDAATEERLLKAAKNIGDSMASLLECTKIYFKDSQNTVAKAEILENASRLEAYCQDILTDAGVTAALTALRYHAKLAVARSVKLINVSIAASECLKDKDMKKKLDDDIARVTDNINAMIHSLQIAAKKPNDIGVQKQLLNVAKVNIPSFRTYIDDIRKMKKLGRTADEKKHIQESADALTEALDKLDKACRTVGNIGSQNEIEIALEEFEAINVDLDAAMFAADQGLLTSLPGQTRDNALEMLLQAARSLTKTLELLTSAAKKGKQLSSHVRDCASGVGEIVVCSRTMASTLPDRPTQRRIVSSAKAVSSGTLVLISSSRVLVSDVSSPEKVRAVDQDHAKVRSALATLLAASKGLDARECDEALATFAVELTKLTSSMPTATNYKQASDSLVAIAKAMMAAISQLVGTARSNPRGVGSAAKITCATLVQFIQAINAAASTAEAETAENILKCAKTFVERLSDLMNTVKHVSINRDAESMTQLENDNRVVLEALQAILVALGNAMSLEADEAIRIIMEAVQSLDILDGVNSKNRAQVLEDFTDISQSLNAILASLVSSSKNSAATMGVFSKEAAVTIQQLLESSKSAAKNAATPVTSPVSTAIQDLIKCCEYVLKYPTDSQKVTGVTKKATQCCQLLVNIAKGMALKLTAPEEKPRQQAILRAAKAVAVGGSHLADCAVTMALPALTDAAKALMGHAKDLEDACGDGGNHIDPSSSQRLSASSRTVGVAVADLIRACASVAAKKKDSDVELASANSSMHEAVTNMLAVIRSLNPGIQECIRTEDKLQNTNNEFDAISIALSAGSGNLANPGKSHTDMVAEFVDVCKLLGSDAAEFTSAAAGTDSAHLVKAAKALQKSLALFETATRGCIATSQSAQTQTTFFHYAKTITDDISALVRSGKEADTNVASTINKLNAASAKTGKDLGAIISSLSSTVAIVSDIEKVIVSVSSDSQLLDTKLEPDLVRKRYNQYRDDATAFATRQLDQLVQNLASTTSDSVGQLGLHAKRIGDGFPAFVASIRGASSSTTDSAAAQGVAVASKAFADAVLAVLEQAKAVAKDPQNPVAQQKLRGSTQPVSAAATKLVEALKLGAVGEVMCEKAISIIQEAVGQLNTNIIFAQAGQLEVDKSIASSPIAKLQETLIASANNISGSSKSVSDATAKGQDAVGQTAVPFAKTYTAVATATSYVASRLPELSSQQDLLSSAKFLGIRAQQLVLVAKDKDAAANQSIADASLSQAREGVLEATNTLISACQRATANAGAGERELDNARKMLLSFLQSVPGYDSATPEDVIKATREVTAAVAGLIYANSPSDVVAGAQRVIVTTEVLLNACKTCATSSLPEVAKALLAGSDAAGKAMIELVEACKLSKSDPSSQGKRDSASSRVTNALADIVAALRSTPEAKEIVEEPDTDLEDVANSELLKAAKIIEDAAALLARARPVREAKDPNIIDEASLTDAILAAAQAIAEATGGLIAAATAAQHERQLNQKNNPTEEKYHKDPVWANGLISAAKAVAAAVRQLVIAANTAAQGRADQEVLIVSARTVQAATISLVAACRAKADPLSRTQQRLSECAKAVTDATNRLVRAAQNAANYAEANTDVSETSGYASSTQAKYSQQIKIMQLEAQIKAERERLTKMNKAEYNK